MSLAQILLRTATTPAEETASECDLFEDGMGRSTLLCDRPQCAGLPQMEHLMVWPCMTFTLGTAELQGAGTRGNVCNGVSLQ